ncbi:MAG: 3-hydroxyacyl-CoA dehydrogenase family protein [Myxococcota bacterium]
MEIRSVAVIGGGLMGSGIAQVTARAGVRTVVVRGSGGPIAKLREKIEKALGSELERGKLTAEERDFTLANLVWGDAIDQAAECDLVIESILEDIALKRALFEKLDGLARSQTIFASNTSTLRIGDLAAATGRAERFLGMHFFNPPTAMKLCEVIPAKETTAEVTDTARAFVLRVNKTPVVVRDAPGFVVNRLLVPYLLDAVRLLEEGVAGLGDIDTSMQLGAGLPLGPFALMDLIGLDVCLEMSKNLYAAMQGPRLSPPALLRKLVNDGALGRKAGRGFYDYSQKPPVPVRGLGPRHVVQASDRPAVGRGAME